MRHGGSGRDVLWMTVGCLGAQVLRVVAEAADGVTMPGEDAFDLTQTQTIVSMGSVGRELQVCPVFGAGSDVWRGDV
jgi:hypothetical protein